VFEFNANNPVVAAVASDSTVHSVENSLNAGESLTAEMASGGNGIVVVDNSGADGTRRLLRLHATTISANTYDPSTDWFGAGGVKRFGGCGAGRSREQHRSEHGRLLHDHYRARYRQELQLRGRPHLGAPETPGPVQYAQLRYNGGPGVAGGQIFDSSLTGVSAQSTITAGWHVMTLIKSGSTITYRLDGQPIATAQITSTLPFTASDFMIGGGFGASSNAGQENGVPPPFIGEFQAYSGVVAGADLSSAEMLAGNSIGLTLDPTVPVPPDPTISLSDPGTVQEASVGAGVTVTETITTTNLTGTVYADVLTASGAVETGYTAVTLIDGMAAFTVRLAKSGDSIQVVDNSTTPTVSATSSPVSIHRYGCNISNDLIVSPGDRAGGICRGWRDGHRNGHDNQPVRGYLLRSPDVCRSGRDTLCGRPSRRCGDHGSDDDPQQKTSQIF